MNNARRAGSHERAAAGWVFFITHVTGTSKLFRRFPQEEKGCDVLVQLKWAMKNALVPAPPFG
jgi:hypothetical protein